MVRSFVLSTNHVRRCNRYRSPVMSACQKWGRGGVICGKSIRYYSIKNERYSEYVHCVKIFRQQMTETKLETSFF